MFIYHELFGLLIWGSDHTSPLKSRLVDFFKATTIVMEKVMSGFTLLLKHTITSHKIFSLLIICLVFLNSSFAQTNSNGLTKTGNNFELGGTLTKDTKVDLGATFWFKLSKNTQDYLTVLNGGNVGIGLSSPSYLLDVNGAVRIGSLTSDPTGNNGVLYYNNSTNKLKGYVNGAWKNVLMEGDVSGNSLPVNQIAYGTGSGVTSSSNFTYDGNALGLGNGHSLASQSGAFIFNTASGNLFSYRINGGLALEVGTSTKVYGDLNTYSSNGQSVQLRAGDSEPETWASGRLQMGYSQTGNYGWIQALNNGINLHLQKTGGKVLLGNTTDQGDYKLQVEGSGYFNGDISLNGVTRKIIG